MRYFHENFFRKVTGAISKGRRSRDFYPSQRSSNA